MSWSERAVRRPIATAMVFVALTTLGAFAFDRLRVDIFPELDFPSISVVTTYPGVGPEEMETLITRPIEQAVAQVEGIDRIESFSSEGRSRVALRFDWGVGLEEALNDVRAAIERTRAIIPEDADLPIVYKFDVGNFPVVHLALEADMSEGEMRLFADEVVKPRFERVVGVASVDVRGARLREIRVEIRPDRLVAFGLTPADVAMALRNENITVPAGIVESGDQNVLVRAMSEFRSIADIEGALVTVRGGHPVRVRDVAHVVDDFEDVVNVVRINGRQGVEIRITKSPDANTIEVVDRLYETVDRFNRDFEGRAQLRLTIDSSTFIRRAISGVQASILFGAVLALVVLLVFLRDLRSTVVIGIAIPIAVIGTFLLMEQLSLTLNLISFGGLALGTGMLVDNSIVILENIYRRRESGDPPIEAAIRGAQEVGGAIVASTLTTVAVFAPVIFLGGFARVFFEQMALVVSSALAFSLLVALTLVPVLASRLLKRGKVAALSSENQGTSFVERVYGRLVAFTLHHRLVVIAASTALLVWSSMQAERIGTELLPETDESEVSIMAEYPPGTKIAVTTQAVARIEALIREHVPEATDITATIGTPGFWSTSGEESAMLRVNLVSISSRSRSSAEIADALRPILARELPGMRAFARPGGGLFILRFVRGGDTRVRVDIRGYDLETSDRLTREVATVMRETEGVTSVRPSRNEGGAELRLTADRDRAADFGLSTRQVAEFISTLVQGTWAGVFRERGDEFRIRVQLSQADLEDLDRVLDTPLVLPLGGTTRLADLVSQQDGTTPQAIDRLDQQRIVTISADPMEGRDLGSINADLEAGIAQLTIPDEFEVRVVGEAEQQQDSFSSLGVGVILAILLVYMVMAAQFESLVQPLIILVAIPFAAVGVIWTLVLTNTTFNLNSFMGVIVLVGVVVNNAIVLVDYINLMRREQGWELTEAIVESARRRLRPILMTTTTTVLALLPVAFGNTEGGETQAPLARVVVGGLTTSTLITLILVPVLYSFVARAGIAWTRWRASREAKDAAA